MIKKTRICLDLRITQKSSRFTGTGIYASHLPQELLAMETDFEFYFLVLQGYPLPFALPADRLISVKRPSKPESLREVYDIIDLRSKLRRQKISLFHSMVPGILTPSTRLSVVVTVHDIIPDVIPAENHGSKLIKWLYKLKMSCASKASHIIADSNITRMDLSQHYNVPLINITTVYLGSQFRSGDYFSVKTSSARPWPRSYMLYLGGFNYRKNVPAVLHAFSKIAKKFPQVDLLLAGNPSELQSAELKTLCNNLNLGERIVWLGFVPDEDLPNLYVWSEAFLYPSLYEGFGLPVLEAMQFGAPVITSDRGSIPEIVKQAGLTINPEHSEQIADAMKKILSDKNLQKKLRQDGEIQAKFFSWSKCAQDTLDVYKKVLG